MALTPFYRTRNWKSENNWLSQAYTAGNTEPSNKPALSVFPVIYCFLSEMKQHKIAKLLTIDPRLDF